MIKKETLLQLAQDIQACRLSADRFAATATAHRPRPVTWFEGAPRIVICGQAPGMRVHKTGLPFNDPSGDRLRDWMGVTRDCFYDKTRIAIVPMAFCFPGYDAKGADLPPPKLCAQTWHARVFAALPEARLTLLVGGYAHKFHLGTRKNVSETVADWRQAPKTMLPLPHPSWRNTGWLAKNPWFAAELLPVLKTRVSEALT